MSSSVDPGEAGVKGTPGILTDLLRAGPISQVIAGQTPRASGRTRSSGDAIILAGWLDTGAGTLAVWQRRYAPW